MSIILKTNRDWPDEERRPLDDGDIRTALVGIAEHGDRKAFAELFRYFGPRLIAYARKAGMTPQAAEEMAQETMIAVWRKAKTYDPNRASGAAWIFAIARNKRIDLWRGERRPEVEAFAAESVDEPVSSAEVAYDAIEDQRVVAMALDQLPEEQAAILRKAFFEDKSHSDISEELSIPLGTVKSRARLGLARMRVLLAEDRP